MLILDHCGFDIRHKQGMRINRPLGCINYLFVLFHDTVTIMQDNRMIEGEKNSYILFHKYSPQLYYNEQQGYTHDFLHISGDELVGFVMHAGLAFDQLTSIRDISRITAVLQKIRDEVTLKHDFQPTANNADQNIDIYIKMLLLELAKDSREESFLEPQDFTTNLEMKYYTDFQNIRNELYMNPSFKWSADRMAKKAYTGLSQFQHLYKKFFGISPTQDLIRARINYAKYLLQNTPGTISHISELCGYENEEHFIRQFKKMIGMTPSKYRQDMHYQRLK